MTPNRTYDDENTRETLNGEGIFTRAHDARVNAVLTGGDLPADLRAAAAVLEAQDALTGSRVKAGASADRAREDVRRLRDQTYRERLRAHRGDVVEACRDTARTLRTRAGVTL